MGLLILRTFFLAVFAFFLLSIVEALELEEIRPGYAAGRGSKRLGRRDLSAFELRSTETFLWGAQGKLYLAWLDQKPYQNSSR